MEDILEFQGEYRWLSNFSPCKISYGGLQFDSVEHAYQDTGKKVSYKGWTKAKST